MARRFDLTRHAYAHRGLWTPDGPPENSLASFRAAAAAGLGIEFDLRPSADGEIMVFHDPVLGRLTRQDGHFGDQPAAALTAMHLTETLEPIPRFEDLLGLWPQDLPLLAEMKIDGATDPADFAAKVGARLLDWPGLAAAMSFSEAAVRALPGGLMRGQLVVPSGHGGAQLFEEITRRALADGIDYLAVHVTDLARAANLTQGTGLPLAVWTVRTVAELDTVRPYGAGLIFEHFDPALALGARAP